MTIEQKRDAIGRYVKKTNWVAVTITVAAFVTTIGYFIHTPKNVPQTKIEAQPVQIIVVAPPADDCYKTGDHAWTCGTAQAIAEMNAFLESKTFVATVTEYTSRKQETDGSPEIAANGENIWKLYQKHDNTCATNDYKIGTRLTIPGLGDCTVRDRMNRRYNGKQRVDFYRGYDTKSALAFGVKKMKVSIN